MSKLKKIFFVIIAILAVIVTIMMTVVKSNGASEDLIFTVGDKQIIIPGDVLDEGNVFCVAKEQLLPDNPEEYVLVARSRNRWR